MRQIFGSKNEHIVFTHLLILVCSRAKRKINDKNNLVPSFHHQVWNIKVKNKVEFHKIIIVMRVIFVSR